MFDIQSSTARRPHKSPAHTVKDLNHLLTVSVSALEHFVPSEPLILHRFSCPSTPSAKSFCCRCCRPEGDASGGRRIIGMPPTFDKQFLKLFFMFRVRRCSHAKLFSFLIATTLRHRDELTPESTTHGRSCACRSAKHPQNQG